MSSWRQADSCKGYEKKNMRLSSSGSSKNVIFSTRSMLLMIAMATLANARSERDILMSFFNSTSGPRWKNSMGWGEDGKSICEWHGIECVASLAESGIGVETITLKENSLIGSATTEIFELPFLRRLILTDNFLSQFSFEKIQLAASLEALDLSGNGISSVEGISFASKNLVNIKLSDNKIKGPIAEELLALTNVKRLHLGNNGFTSQIPPTISNLINLEVLELNGNQLTGEIPDEVGELFHLKELYLGDNYFTGNVPSSISLLSNLGIFSVHRGTKNEEEGKDHVLFGPLPTFSDCASLIELDLSGNSFTGEIPVRFLKFTEVGDEKITVNLHDNELTGGIPIPFGDRFEQLFIDVTGNQIDFIPPHLCDKNLWMGGDVGVFGCDAILCPLGTANFEGRQTTANSTCVPCIFLETSTYLGHTECVDDNIESEESLTEKDILIQFFDKLDGENWAQNSFWKDDNVSICSWYGVICRDQVFEIEELGIKYNEFEDLMLTNPASEVVSISLPANKLSGTVPKEIYLLPNLIYLDIGKNLVDISFEGIGQSTLLWLTLTNTNLMSLKGITDASILRNLVVDRNEMSGKFPEELTNMPNLHVLDLSFNFFTGELPTSLVNLPELRRLNVYGNSLRSKIPTEIGMLSKLTVLDLSENDFSGQLPTELNNLSSLEQLSIHQTGRHGPGINGRLPDFSNLQVLTKIDLDSNEFSGEIPESFLSGIIDKAARIRVGLSWNKITGTIPASLDSFSKMNIDLVGNEITGIAPELCDNGKWMDGKVSEYQCDAILCPSGTYNIDGFVWNPDFSCAQCPSAIYYGSVDCEKIDETPDSINERAILESFFYATGGRSWHDMGNWTAPWIPVCNWKGISCDSSVSGSEKGVEVINLENFGLGGEIPSDIYNLPTLKHLNIAGNRVDIIFDGIDKAKLLHTLIISDTGLESVEGVENAVGLSKLDVSKNMLTGRLPEELFSLTNLRYLSIAENSFSGFFPDDVSKLSNLRELHCYQNKFSGVLPDSLKSVSSLRILNFGKNQLNGPIPQMIHDMNFLQSIDLSDQTSDDGITGQLLDFADFLTLRNLNLARNSLSGSIPISFLMNSALNDEPVSIDLSYNTFSGSVPVTLSKFHNLSINLIGNLITAVPPELCGQSHNLWMGGNVQLFQCDAILCPTGTANTIGLQDSFDNECLPCGEGTSAPFMGSTECLNEPEIELVSETDILIDFYKKAGGLNWKKQVNWMNLDIGICRWEGVVCGTEIGLDYSGVVELRLPNNNLNTLDDAPVASLFNLSSLKTLDVSNNLFFEIDLAGLKDAKNLEILILSGIRMSSLEGIGAAASLQQLNIAGNLISGSIPDELFSLVDLHRLYLSSNNFKGAFNPKIKNLTKLRFLYCANNQLTGELPREIGQLTKLMRLDLSENFFSGNLPGSYDDLTLLELLNLGKQKSLKGLSGPLPDFRIMKVLTTLSLEENSFSGIIPSTFLADSQVKTDDISINFSFNSLSGPIPIELNDFTSLDINLVGNEFTDLPSDFCDNSLWMNGNVDLFQCSAILCPAGQFNPAGRQENAKSPCMPCIDPTASNIIGNTRCGAMSEREILQKLFSTNGGEEWDVATNWNEESIGICNWYGISCTDDSPNDDEGVITIDLSKGDDTGNGVIGHIPEEIFRLPYLRILNFKGNAIDIDFSSIVENDSIEVLYLSDTNLTSIDGIDALLGVKELHLTDIGVTGDIDQIFEMKLLEHVFVSYNFLTGSIARLGELRNLVGFFAIENEITGFIPSTIGALSKLSLLALSGNYITGELPSSLGSLSNLEEFANANNPDKGPGLTGKLIDFSGTKLRQLTLNYNSLTGSIPESFFQGTDSDADDMMIWLAFNHLTGAVPVQLDRLNGLDLRLEGNQITSLPTELCDIDNNNWMRGNVELYGCDAILCPAGTYNSFGRQKHEFGPCTPCQEVVQSPYFGRTSCDLYSEKYVLTEVFFATGGPTWENSINWTSDYGICSWYGITCSSDSDGDSEVTRIDLAENLMVGTVPSLIFQLPHLEELILRSNDISLTFEGAVFPNSLTEIALSKTNVDSLDGIGAAKSLQKLHLVNMRLKGTIPEELYELTELEELYLSYNELSGTISTKIGKLQELRYLALFDNKMRGTLPSELGKLHELRDLVLSENYFTGHLPIELENLVNIVSFSMFKHEGNGIGLSGNLLTFAKWERIQELILEYNSFTGTIPSDFLASADPEGIIEVGLGWNLLSGEIPENLDRFESLNIALTGNMFTELPTTFCDNKKWMGGAVAKYSCDAILCPIGSVTDFGRQSFARDPCQKCEDGTSTPFLGSTQCVMSEFDILAELYIQCGGDNWNNNDGWLNPQKDICEWFGLHCDVNGRVNAILLGSNNLQGDTPKELFDLPQLHSLWLYSNPIEFSFEGIENARSLESLLLDSTGIDVLDGLENAVRLKELGLRFNQITGTIPTQIANLQGLESLSLSDNLFSGTLPTFLEKLYSLKKLRLGSNELSGPLLEFRYLPNIYSFDLSGNQLTGTIPYYFLLGVPQDSSLVIDLSSNSLSGEVPASFARLRDLTFYIRDNHIDNIPAQLCKQRAWNDGGVSEYGCLAIACPPGTFNSNGRQKSSQTPCISCADAEYYGSITCSDITSDDYVHLSGAMTQHGNILFPLLATFSCIALTWLF